MFSRTQIILAVRDPVSRALAHYAAVAAAVAAINQDIDAHSQLGEF